MRILLTNDDGIDAPGLESLRAAVVAHGGNPVIVAPAEPHSGCGHRVTTDRPLRVHALGPDRYAVEGTPADCVRLALGRLAADVACVVSGINAGGNLGVDIHHSGTVAAAREAALHGRPALAASHYHRRGTEIDWRRAASWLEAVLATVPLAACGRGEFWNVNLPDLPPDVAVPDIVACEVDASPFVLGYAPTDDGFRYESNYHERPRVSGGDVAVCFGGRISLSRLRAV